ncbi:hypothetical protein BpHYR1_017818 [Brachionus plicatilis]|uniref:Uncharacterized protein n=1 Tax=Brachionus plicatilis TaxID=10195 RepID=A0A3M7RM91_BRAPC|nr:hypothetical protein BpHYR1_017818 [Brachionus plicatilis]
MLISSERKILSVKANNFRYRLNLTCACIKKMWGIMFELSFSAHCVISGFYKTCQNLINLKV